MTFSSYFFCIIPFDTTIQSRFAFYEEITQKKINIPCSLHKIATFVMRSFCITETSHDIC